MEGKTPPTQVATGADHTTCASGVFAPVDHDGRKTPPAKVQRSGTASRKVGAGYSNNMQLQPPYHRPDQDQQGHHGRKRTPVQSTKVKTSSSTSWRRMQQQHATATTTSTAQIRTSTGTSARCSNQCNLRKGTPFTLCMPLRKLH